MIKYFALQEFLHSDTADSMDVNNYPTWEVVANLERLAMTMECIRAGLGNYPVTILSGFRCDDVNAAVGGATNSAHRYGLACDFMVPMFGTPLDICKEIQPHMEFLRIDQLIHEFSDWVHIGLTDGIPRYECLTIDDNGTREGFA